MTWTDGWPRGVAIEAAAGSPPEQLVVDFARTAALDPEWVSVRRTATEVAALGSSSGRLTITADGSELGSPRPWFVGRRQRHLGAAFSATVDVSAGVGGVALRLSEDHILAVEARPGTDGYQITARAILAGFERTWTAALEPGELRLGMDLEPPSADFRDGMVGGDRVRLWAEDDRERITLAELDGRYWTYETAKSFTGRVLGMYAVEGVVTFGEFAYDGSDDLPS